MTQTTNIGLKKIDGSENWRQIFDYHNDSADKTDSAVAAVQDGLAIVANGNTHAAVAEGQFVYVRNHSTLAEGLYKASSTIGTNAALSTSNLTADGNGGLNDLQEQVTSLNRKITSGEFYKLDQGYMLESYAGAGEQPTNLNNVTHGLYYVGSSAQNRPEDYCLVLSFCVGNYVSQLGFGVTSQNVYYRHGRASGTDFSAWKNISG